MWPADEQTAAAAADTVNHKLLELTAAGAALGEQLKHLQQGLDPGTYQHSIPPGCSCDNAAAGAGGGPTHLSLHALGTGAAGCGFSRGN